MTFGASGHRGRADVLFSKIIRERGRCRSCGERDYDALQCSHVISRRFNATRTDLDNAYALCWRCHGHFTGHLDEWMAFVDSTIGRDEYDRLRRKAEVPTRIDWVEECARLAVLHKLILAFKALEPEAVSV